MRSILDAIEAGRQGDNGLPNAVYTSPEFMHWERDHLFAPGWFAIGFGADVATPGDMRRVDALGQSMLVVRDRSNALRVFHNVCRHRGRRLLDEDCRHAAAIRCPYHAWTYALDGTLRGTPHVGGAGVHEVAGFDKNPYSLFTIRSHVWRDIVFINLDGNAPPFETFIAPVEARLARLWGDGGAESLQPAADGFLEMEVVSNWKLAVENYLEAYHLPVVHPGLNSYSPLANHYAYHDGADYAGQGVTSYRPNFLAGPAVPTLPTWNVDQLHTAEYPALYPNTLLGVQNDHFFVMILLPLACDRTLERVELQFVGEAASATDYRKTRLSILEGWRSVFAEDVSAVEGMQAGRYSPAFDGGVFTPLQDAATRHFHRWFARRVGAATPRQSLRAATAE